MGCCCSSSGRGKRSTARIIDPESGYKIDSPEQDGESKKESDSEFEPSDNDGDSMKSEEGNIVTDRLGHLVGPDSARTSLQLPGESFTVQRDAFTTRFACVQFYQSDKILLIDFPESVIQVVHDTVLQYWPKGIQAEDAKEARTYTFKLKGAPWRGETHDKVAANRLAKTIIESLYDRGWVLNLASGVSPGTTDKDALIFRHQDPPPAQCDWMAFSFGNPGTPKINLLDAPPDVVHILVESLANLTTKHSAITGERVHEFELKDNPFSMGKRKTLPQELMLTLLPALEKCGFSVSATLSLYDGLNSPDTWYCCRPVGWTPGLPIYHR